MTTNMGDAASILWQQLATAHPHRRVADGLSPGRSRRRLFDAAQIATHSGQAVVGWKIAATSAGGQKLLGVDGPLAGPLLANRVLQNGAAVPLDGNVMKVAESEFAFTFRTGLPKRGQPYTQAEVLAAVGSLHPAIEVPDSRYHDFGRVGAAQLIADTACACWFVLGPATGAEWRGRDLAAHPVTAYLNGTKAATGAGANVLGDPRVALTWLVNELRTFGDGIEAGQFVTTGACMTPSPIAPGDSVRADFGEFGSVEAKII